MDGLPLVVNFPKDLPVTAMENVEGYYSLGAILGDSGNLFLIRMQDDSMTGAGINDGNILVVKQQSKVGDGEIGVAIVDGQASVRKIYFQGNHIRLTPENPKFSVFKFDPEKRDIRIAGSVIGIIKKIS